MWGGTVAPPIPAVHTVPQTASTHPHRSRPYATVPMPGSLAHKPTRVKLPSPLHLGIHAPFLGNPQVCFREHVFDFRR
jgi:hypothetical protein